MIQTIWIGGPPKSYQPPPQVPAESSSVLDYIERHPGITVAEMITAFHASRGTIKGVVARLHKVAKITWRQEPSIKYGRRWVKAYYIAERNYDTH